MAGLMDTIRYFDVTMLRCCDMIRTSKVCPASHPLSVSAYLPTTSLATLHYGALYILRRYTSHFTLHTSKTFILCYTELHHLENLTPKSQPQPLSQPQSQQLSFHCLPYHSALKQSIVPEIRAIFFHAF